MKKLIILIMAILLLIPVVNAQSIDAGVTPDSPFYFMDKAMEKIRLGFTFNIEKKSELRLKYAEERLSEANQMKKEGKLEYANEVMAEYRYQKDQDQNSQYQLQDANRTNDPREVIISKRQGGEMEQEEAIAIETG